MIKCTLVLLENNVRRTYVAQSGLLNEKGQRWEKQHPYTTDQKNYLLNENEDTIQVSYSTL